MKLKYVIIGATTLMSLVTGIYLKIKQKEKNIKTYQPRKNLYIVEQNGKVYFRVKINKAKKGLKIDKTFTKYNKAIEFLERYIENYIK